MDFDPLRIQIERNEDSIAQNDIYYEEIVLIRSSLYNSGEIETLREIVLSPTLGYVFLNNLPLTLNYHFSNVESKIKNFEPSILRKYLLMRALGYDSNLIRKLISRIKSGDMEGWFNSNSDICDHRFNELVSKEFKVNKYWVLLARIFFQIEGFKPNFNNWNHEEDKELINLYSAGYRDRQIAMILNRTEGTVSVRLNYLRHQNRLYTKRGEPLET